MYLEQKLKLAHMQKRERIDPFLTKLQEIRDELVAGGSTPQGPELVRLALVKIPYSREFLLQH